MAATGEVLDMTNCDTVTQKPRSRRVGMAGPPSELGISSLGSAPSVPLSLPPPASPPIPPRSPLRPVSRTITVSSIDSGLSSRRQSSINPNTPPSPLDDALVAIADSSFLAFHMQDHSEYSPPINIGATSQDSLLSKELPVRPESPLSISPDDENSFSSSSSVAPQTSPMSKRHHALHELLSSERAYASDLALIREVHIPLALGQSVPLHNIPISPPNSSASSSRTVSTASDSSTGSLGPPMTQEDVKIIFSNIAELALFSDLLCEELEEALGSVVEGGQGEDHVGELFLRIIPELERPYKQYITRHASALNHLQALPSTPALTAYIAHAQHVASALSHAWDLSSLLIKPVQRLLKYPLLLAAIIDETPETHPDKDNLKLARTRMEEVARNVNEGRRRAEVVKDVLTSKKKPINVSVAAQVNLSKMKGLRHGSKGLVTEGNSEAAEVEKMQAELKRIDVFAQQFAKNVLDWAKMMANVIRSLRVWSLNFGHVIGLSAEQGSEAFDAFLAVVEQQLMPLCIDLEAVINERLLKEVVHLLTTMNKPFKLLASMNEQEPFHYHLLTMNVSAKNRPPPTLLAASMNYLALRGQLAAELPQYLKLLHRGLATVVRTLAMIQTEFWRDVRDRWGDLWEMLRVEGELNAGHTETVNVWRARWGDVDEVLGMLNIAQSRKLYQEPIHSKSTSSTVYSTLSSLDPSHSKRPPVQHANTLSSFEPAHGPYVSPPYALTPSKSRTRGASDASAAASRRSLGRRTSNDSLHSGKSSKAKSPRRPRQDEQYFANSTVPYGPAFPALPRTKSMPLGVVEQDHHRRASSSSRAERDSDTCRAVEPQHQHQQHHLDDKEQRGRISRNPSYKRKSTTDATRRPSTGRQRSGSIKSITSFFGATQDTTVATVDAMPSDSRTLSSAQRDSWVNKPAKYMCQVIHPCKPPAAVAYFSFPFFTLIEGDLYEVLQEAGHPSIHPKLPLYVDDGEDCLLLCRDERGQVGWALASFLEPINLPN